jgi:hypothetical protein
VNGVYWDSLPMVDMNNKSTQNFEFDNCTFEIGPNGVAMSGQGEVAVISSYGSDGYNSKNAVGWLPTQVVARGDFIYPSASVTGSITTGTALLTLSSVTNAYAGQKLTVVGAGSAGANLTARILSITGSVATLDTNAGTTVASAGVYYGARAGHCYRCITPGTTDSSQPTWPTTAGGTVTDGSAVWREYGSGALYDLVPAGATATKNSVSISAGCLVGTWQVGILGIRASGQQPQAVVVSGCAFSGNDYVAQFDGAGAVAFIGNEIKTYNNLGVEYLAAAGNAPELIAIGNYPGSLSFGADFVISSNSTGIGGLHVGNTILTGIAANRLASIFTTSGSASLFLPGTLTVAGLTTLAAVLASGSILTTSLNGIGYGTGGGAGSTATQTTSRTNGVTMNRVTGKITLFSASTTAGQTTQFTFTNSKLGATDTINWTQLGGSGVYFVAAKNNGDGTATVSVYTPAAVSAEAPSFQFNVIKGSQN